MSDNPFEAGGSTAPLQRADLQIRPATELAAIFQESARLWVAVVPIVAIAVVLTAIPSSLFSTWLGYQELDVSTQIRITNLVDSLFTLIQVGAVGTVLHRATLDIGTTPLKALWGGLALFIPMAVLNIPVGLAIVCGLLLFIVPGVYLGTRLCLTHVVYMMRGNNLGEALGDSWRLTEGRFGPTFLVALCSGLASLAVAFVYLALVFGWAIVAGVLVELGGLDEGGVLFLGMDYGVLLVVDVVFAYPFLFGWFPLFVYLAGIRSEAEGDAVFS